MIEWAIERNENQLRAIALKGDFCSRVHCVDVHFELAIPFVELVRTSRVGGIFDFAVVGETGHAEGTRKPGAKR